MNIMYPMNYI